MKRLALIVVAFATLLWTWGAASQEASSRSQEASSSPTATQETAAEAETADTETGDAPLSVQRRASIEPGDRDLVEAPPVRDGVGERGRYLVGAVAMCGQCHSPRSERGELQLDRWLMGAPVPLQTPVGYAEEWAYRAPRISGLPQHTDEEFVRLMTTGVNRDGLYLMPPMPQYRMSEADALAILEYLRSLD